MTDFEGALRDAAGLIGDFVAQLDPRQEDWFRQQPHDEQVAMGEELRGGGRSADEIVTANGGPPAGPARDR
ncbi:hypothetical protein [Kitasatospora sp. NPDC004531]